MAWKIYDKHGIEIKPYDLIKVYHFTGARRKRHYMYKHVLGDYESNPHYFCVSSLSSCGHTYNLLKDNKIHPEIEILQGPRLDKRHTKPVKLDPIICS